MARWSGFHCELKPNGIEFSRRGETAFLAWRSANPHPAVSGEAQSPGVAHYFLGNDRSRWKTGVPTFALVRYRDLYPGIDVVFYENSGELEFDYVIGPGADPAQIRFSVEGVAGAPGGVG